MGSAPVLPDRPTSRETRAIVVVCLATAVVGVNTTAIGVATRGVADELDASLGELEWIMGAYLVAGAAVALLGGRLGDIVGRTRTLLLGLGVFAVGSLFAALAPGPPALIAARAVQGVGAGLVLPASLEVIAAHSPGNRPQHGFRLRGIVYASAFGIGPLIGGLLTDQVSWRAVFWAELAVLLVAVAVGATLGRQESTLPKDPTRDVRGAVLVALLVVTVVLSASRSRSWGWSWQLAAAVVVVVLLVVALRAVERRATHPVVHPGLLLDRVVLGANLATLGASIAMIGLVYFFNVFAQSAVGLDSAAVSVALTLLPFTLSIVVCAQLAALLSRRVGYRGPVVAGLGLAVVGFWWLSTAGAGTTESDVVVPLALCGIGAGIANAGLTSAAVLVEPRARIDEAAGIASLTRFLGSAVAIAIGTTTYLSVAVGAQVESQVPAGSDPEAVLLGGDAYQQALATLGDDLRAPFERVIETGTIDGFTSTMRATAIGLGMIVVVSAALLAPRRPTPEPDPAPTGGGG